jgi:hypothetical protein
MTHGRRIAMERNVERRSAVSLGLCQTCDSLAACTYPRAPRHPVFQCLEFEERSVVETAAPVRKNGRHNALGLSIGDEAERREHGLCADCELRGSCTYPRLPGGVWFCEEFR